MKLRRVLSEKEENRRLVTVSEDASIQDAIELLCTYRIGALLVVSGDGTVCGVISERDVLRRCCASCGNLKSATVTTIMTKDVFIAHADDDVHDALKVMSAKRIRHLPVFDGQELVGIVSVGDLLGATCEEDELKIHHLNDFLGGTYGSTVY